MPLTKIECDRAACPSERAFIRLTDGKGMYLEVLAAGGKYWRMKYRHTGKEKRLAFGVYPAVSLAQARKARDQAREALARGDDPAQLKREAKLSKAINDATTFEGVARQWWAHWNGPKSPRHADYVLRRLEADVFPALGARPVASVTAPQLLAMAKGIEARGAVDIAKRSLQTCGQIMRFAVAQRSSAVVTGGSRADEDASVQTAVPRTCNRDQLFRGPWFAHWRNQSRLA